MLKWNKHLLIAYHNTFESPEGKRVLADLRKRCVLMNDTINTSAGIDVNKLVYLEGQRSVLMHIYKMLRRDPNEEAPEPRQGE